MEIAGRERTLLGLASVLIPTSFGSIFLLNLGLHTLGFWLFGGVGYNSELFWTALRGYDLTRFEHTAQSWWWGEGRDVLVCTHAVRREKKPPRKRGG